MVFTRPPQPLLRVGEERQTSLAPPCLATRQAGPAYSTLAVPSARCTYPYIHVWYLQQPPFERKRANKQTHKPTYLPTYRPTDRPTDYNNPSLRMRTRGLIIYTVCNTGNTSFTLLQARKAEFLFADAIERGCDCVVVQRLEQRWTWIHIPFSVLPRGLRRRGALRLTNVLPIARYALTPCATP